MRPIEGGRPEPNEEFEYKDNDLEKRFPKKEFHYLDAGGLFEVMRYEKKGSGVERVFKKAKRIEGEYPYTPFILETNRKPDAHELKDRLKAEDAYLRQSFQKELPDLIPPQKFILDTKSESDEVYVMQDFIDGKELSDPAVFPEESKEILAKQIETFTTIVKRLAFEKNKSDFQYALPDLSMIQNLKVDEVHGEPILKLIDTNSLLSFQDKRFNNYNARIAYHILWLEVNYLGKSIDELENEEFYEFYQTTEYVKKYLPELPLPDHSNDTLIMSILSGEKAKSDALDTEIERVAGKLKSKLENLPLISRVEVNLNESSVPIFSFQTDDGKLYIEMKSRFHDNHDEYHIEIYEGNEKKVEIVAKELLEEFFLRLINA